MSAIVLSVPSDTKPCPFCSGRDLHIETDSAQGATFQVMCDNPKCEASGPNSAASADDALLLWNERPGA